MMITTVRTMIDAFALCQRQTAAAAGVTRNSRGESSSRPPGVLAVPGSARPGPLRPGLVLGGLRLVGGWQVRAAVARPGGGGGGGR